VASLAEFIFIPLVVALIGGMIIMVVGFDLEAESSFQREAHEGFSRPMIQSVANTLFKEVNAEGVSNYRAISYRICTGSTSRNSRNTEFSSEPEASISSIITHARIRVDSIPSRCSSASSYEGETLYGSKKIGRRDYFYETKMPVIGGDLARVNFIYEIE